ncbi:MAG: C69 family dipeptidase [Solobacterium sp.]|nr:C69 family dipeptidase [Solobacterium sp.]
MACTTLLVGKKASYDGSTFTARNEDSGHGHYFPKKFTVVHPEDQPDVYRSVISHAEIKLPKKPMRYTAMPHAFSEMGIWAAAGVNEANVSMTATETITTNERVLAGDPLVRRIPAEGDTPEIPGGIGEEDIVVITLPYIRSAREGVIRLGSLLEKYGTYETNGIAFQDVDEIWWLETIGGHHWIARRVPDNAYVVAPNQFGIDEFDLEDAFGEQKEHMCSADLREFIMENHLDLSLDGKFNARYAFGSHSDQDHSYNTPRQWAVQRYFNPRSNAWDGADADYRPDDDDIPWCRVPEHKITVDEMKWALSNHYQGTEYDPYAKYGDPSRRNQYRVIGINRNDFVTVVQIRPYLPEAIRTIEWVALGSNAFNALVPFYANIDRTPEYLANTTRKVTTESFYWANRIIAALADASFSASKSLVERYQSSVLRQGLQIITAADKAFLKKKKVKNASAYCEEVNGKVTEMLEKETQGILAKVLDEATNVMKNSYSRNDY